MSPDLLEMSTIPAGLITGNSFLTVERQPEMAPPSPVIIPAFLVTEPASSKALEVIVESTTTLMTTTLDSMLMAHPPILAQKRIST